MKTMIFAVLLLGSPAGALELAGVRQALDSDGGTGTAWNALYDNGVGTAGSAVRGGEGRAAQALPVHGAAATGLASREVPPPAPAGAPRSGGVWEGVKNGASQGALFGFYPLLTPSVHLLSEGFGRRMSRAYDGERSDNVDPGVYTAAGIALAVVLYIPALALGAVGGAVGAAAGAAAEAVKPGSTSKWDAERALFG